MRAVIQRVTQASVTINNKVKSEIGLGLLILLGVEDADSSEDIEWLSKKIAQLRIFGDAEGLMNLSVQDIRGQIIVVSQFTLYASAKKGNRPSFIRAAKPEVAIPIYEKFLIALRETSGLEVLTGEFGADMKVALLNDGPVTVVMDSKVKE